MKNILFIMILVCSYVACGGAGGGAAGDIVAFGASHAPSDVSAVADDGAGAFPRVGGAVEVPRPRSDIVSKPASDARVVPRVEKRPGWFSCFGGSCVPVRSASVSPVHGAPMIDDALVVRPGHEADVRILEDLHEKRFDKKEHKRLLRKSAEDALKKEDYAEAMYIFKYLGDRDAARDVAPSVAENLVQIIKKQPRSEINEYALVKQAQHLLEFLDEQPDTKLFLLKYIRDQYKLYRNRATEDYKDWNGYNNLYTEYAKAVDDVGEQIRIAQEFREARERIEQEQARRELADFARGE